MYKEREELIAELHDELGGDINSILLISQAAIKELNSDLEKTKENIIEICDISSHSLNQLRDFLWIIDLKSNTWEEIHGYFKNSAEKILKRGNITLEWHSFISDKVISPPSFFLRVNLHRIYKEAITNILKHSNATKVNIGFCLKEKSIEITIEDNGKGFDHAQALQRKWSYGLKNIERCARELKGNLYIQSQQREGTLIRLNVLL